MSLTISTRRLTAACAVLAGLGFAVGVVTLGAGTSTDLDVAVAKAHVLYDRDYESVDEMMTEPGAVIVVGRVTEDKATALVGDGVLFTDTRVEVRRVLRGSLTDPTEATIWVRQTGGADGADVLAVEGQKLLAPGEEVMLVLSFEVRRGLYWVVGGAHGYFLLEGDELRHANLGDLSHPLVGGAEHPLVVFARTVNTGDLESAVRSQ